MQKKGILLVGIILLLVGIFIWFSSSNIMSEHQSLKGRLVTEIDIIYEVEGILDNIWNNALYLEIFGFIVFAIGLVLSIAGVGMIKKIEGGNKDKQT